MEELVRLRRRVTELEASRPGDDNEFDVRRSARENAVMGDMARVIGGCADIDEAYQQFADRARRVIPFDAIVISVLDGGHAVPTTGHARVPGLDWRWKAGVCHPIDAEMTRQVARDGTGKVTALKDEFEVRERYPGSLEVFQAGMRLLLSVPVSYGRNVLGVLHLLSRRLDGFSSREVLLAEGLATHIAAVMANARLRAEAARASMELRESEQRHASLAERSPDGIFVHIGGRIEYANAAGAALMGVERAEDLLGRSAPEFIFDVEDVSQHPFGSAPFSPPARNGEAMFEGRPQTCGEGLHPLRIVYSYGLFGRMAPSEDSTLGADPLPRPTPDQSPQTA